MGKNKRKIFWELLIGLFCFAGSLCVQTGSDRQTVYAKQAVQYGAKETDKQKNSFEQSQTGEPVKIRVAFYKLDGFFEYDEHGKECGYGVDYLNELSKYANIQWEYVPVDSWEKIRELLKKGEVDVQMPVTEPAKPNAALSYTVEEVLPSYHAIMTLNHRSNIYYKDYDKIPQLRIAITKQLQKTIGVEDYFSSIGIKEENLFYYEDYNHCKDALVQGKVDALISNIMDLTSDMKVIDKFAVMKNYIVTKKDSPYYSIINAAMTELEMENPSFQSSLYEEYYPERAVEPYTKTETSYMHRVDSLKVGVFTDRKPVSYYDEKSGKFKGIIIDIAELVSKEISIKFNYVPITTENPKDMLTKVDLIVGMNQDGNYMDYFTSQSILDTEVLFAIKEGSRNPKKGDTVGVVDTAEGVQRLLQSEKEFKIKKYKNDNAAIRALQKGEVDVYTNAAYVMNWQLENPRYDNLSLVNYESLPIEYSFCGKAEDTLLQSVLNKGINYLTKAERDGIIKDETNFSMNDLSWSDQIFVYRQLIITVCILITICGALFLFYVKKRDKYIQKIEEQTKQAQQANKAKSQFLSRMSHDMRTPMNGIMGLTYLMEKETNLSVIHNYVSDLQESGRYLLQLINDILDVNKIESGKLELNPKPNNDFTVYKAILDLMRPVMKEKNIHFYYEKENTESQILLLDEQRVKQIFVNLLSNAAKFTPEGGNVSFIVTRLSQDEEMVYKKYVIEDTGIGISQEFLPHVFENFRQEERVKLDSTKGTGLGLSIVKQLVDLMGGTITIDSEVDKGTKITVYLNFKVAEQKAKEKIGETEKEDNDVQNLEEDMRYTGLHILICEDHPLNATIARKLLERKDADVTWAQNGAEGLKKFEESPIGYYNIILMDIRMPVMDGLEATRAIRAVKRDDAKKVVIIAMSANAYDEDIQSSLQAGMNEHLAKPVVPEVLYQAIEKYWKK